MPKMKESTIRRREEHKKKMEKYWRDWDRWVDQVFSMCRKEPYPLYCDVCDDYELMGGTK